MIDSRVLAPRRSRRSAFRVFARRFAVALFAVFWMVGGGIGYAIWRANDEFDRIPRADVSVTDVGSGEPSNFLIIGSDTRTFVDTGLEVEQFGDPDEQTGQRSDTMMVLHLDPKAESAFLVSFPRDLWVDIPGEGEAKLNSAYSRGGPQLAVRTIESNFDVTINHYLEVNFATFRELVDAIGTVHIFFPTSARDTVTGLHVDNPGCVALDKDGALAYVRSRSYEYFDGDGEWKQDPTADIGRIRRQQYFIRSLMAEATAKVAKNPLQATSLLRDATRFLRRDRYLDLQDLYALYKVFKNTDAGAVEMVTIPADLDRSDDGQSILVMRGADADPILERLRQGASAAQDRDENLPDIAPRTVSVAVLNGSGVQGAASDALDAFVAAGFQRGTANNADRSDYDRTEVRYRTGKRDDARVVAAFLTAGGSLVEADDVDADVVVVVGRDFTGIETPAGFGDNPGSATTNQTSETLTPTTRPPPPNPGSTPGVTVPSEQGRPLVGCG
jgi:LCP family protein required for cell wall assembly